MLDIKELSKSFSISFQLFKIDIEDLNLISQILKKFTFTQENKKGILESKKYSNYIEFDYNILIPKIIEVYENGKNQIKKFYTSNLAKIFLGKDFIIYLGSLSQSKKILKDILNLTLIDPIFFFLNSHKMNEIYDNFQKINYLKLFNESDPFIQSFGLNGDLTEKENWHDFTKADTKIIEIRGIYDSTFGPINLRINYDCSGQVYKGKIDINRDLIFWFKDLFFS